MLKLLTFAGALLALIFFAERAFYAFYKKQDRRKQQDMSGSVTAEQIRRRTIKKYERQSPNEKPWEITVPIENLKRYSRIP